MSTWYWKNAHHTEPQGPVSAQELKHLARSNRLRRNDLVRRQGMTDWVPANNLKGLFDVSGPEPVKKHAGNAAHRDASRQEATRRQKVYHSTGMYQKSAQQAQNPNVANAGAYGHTASFGRQSAPGNSFKGMDYEEYPSLFSFRGRMRRTTYFFQSLGFSVGISLLMVIIGFFSGFVFGADSVISLVAIVLLSIASTVILAFPFVKRLHDLNLSAWFFWISIVPIVNILFGLYVLFGRGTVGPNKYGPDPRS